MLANGVSRATSATTSRLATPPRMKQERPQDMKLNRRFVNVELTLVLVVFILVVLCGLVLLLLIRATRTDSSPHVGYPSSGSLRDTAGIAPSSSLPVAPPSPAATGARPHKDESRPTAAPSRLCLAAECVHASSSLLRAIDASADPCVDFYRFACGRWPLHHPLRPDSASSDTLTLLKDSMRHVFKGLLEEPINDKDTLATKQAKTFYKSCVNETVPEQLAERPLLILLEKIGLRWPVVEHNEKLPNAAGRRWLSATPAIPIEQPASSASKDTTASTVSSVTSTPDVATTHASTPSISTTPEQVPVTLSGEHQQQQAPAERAGVFDEFLNSFDWHRSLGFLRRMKMDTFFLIFSQTDQKNSSQTILQVDQAEPMVPSVDLNSARGRRQIEAYHAMMVLAAELLGANRSQATVDMKDVVMFELRIRTFLEPSEKRRNFTRINHRMTLGQLDTLVPHLRVRQLASVVFQRSFSVDEPLVVYAPNYLKKLNGLLKTTPKKILANYMGWRVVFSFMNFIDKRFGNLRQRYANVLSGTSHPVPRWRLCVTLVNHNLGMVTGSMFVKNHYSAYSKLSAESMIADIRAAFLEQLDHLDWMDNQTKAAAKHKALNMRYKVGYPEEILDSAWLDREHQLDLSPDHVFSNILLVNKFRHAKELERFGKPNDPHRWLMTPGTVNAFYTRTGNFITLPAAILQPPMFHPSYPAAKNYGGIGVVIGHEITHGFDDKGRQFDGSGNLAQWWQPEALRRFSERARCVVDQYSSYTVDGVGLSVNGFRTQGENVADNGGLKHAFAAYRKWQQKKQLPLLGATAAGGARVRLPGVNFTDDQLFFITYAQIWCAVATPERVISELRYSDHTPPRYRVLGVLSNSRDFSRAFGCALGTPMNPVKKCSVW